MRIRKRQVPLPLSSLLPVPVSDLYLNRQSVVQLSSSSSSSRGEDGASSQQQSCRWIGEGTTSNGCDLSDRAAVSHEVLKEEKEKDKDELVFPQNRKEKGREKEEKRSSDASKNDNSGVDVGIGSLPRPCPSPQAGGRWNEGDRIVPLKKRKGTSFEQVTIAARKDENDKVTDGKTSTKMNKKCTQQKDSSGGSNNVQEEKEKELEEAGLGGQNNLVSKGKKKGRGGGGVLMEGSRCSRVNGRGWRCCQKTLVGYSLCEHHLGKGRMRSINAKKKKESNSSFSLQEKRGDDGDDDDDEEEEEDVEEKPSMSTKKKVKLGMVKARSISSLLGQTSIDILAPADHDT